MILVSEVLGNLDSKDVLFNNYETDIIRLEHWESSKSRIRKKSMQGREIAISLERGKHLHNNDIIFVDHTNKSLVAVELTLKNILKSP